MHLTQAMENNEKLRETIAIFRKENTRLTMLTESLNTKMQDRVDSELTALQQLNEVRQELASMTTKYQELRNATS
jgi:septal ring factor EnvC (AmiA/AmiB activator)